MGVNGIERQPVYLQKANMPRVSSPAVGRGFSEMLFSESEVSGTSALNRSISETQPATNTQPSALTYYRNFFNSLSDAERDKLSARYEDYLSLPENAGLMDVVTVFGRMQYDLGRTPFVVSPLPQNLGLLPPGAFGVSYDDEGGIASFLAPTHNIGGYNSEYLVEGETLYDWLGDFYDKSIQRYNDLVATNAYTAEDGWLLDSAAWASDMAGYLADIFEDV